MDMQEQLLAALDSIEQWTAAALSWKERALAAEKIVRELEARLTASDPRGKLAKL